MAGDRTKSATDSSRRHFLTGSAVGLAALAAGATGVRADTRQPDTWPWERDGADRFAGKVVLITGATSGIGEATARAFAGQGARVFFCGRRESRGRRVAERIRNNGGEAQFFRADVREEDQVKAFVDACLDTYDGLDIAFNNAGIEGPRGDADAIDLEGEMSYRDVMRTNLDGVFYAMRHELPVMRERGSGVIINTGSMLASRGSGQWGAYAGSKHGVIGLTRSAALGNGRHNVRVLSISPGPVDTALLRRMYGDDLSGIARQNPSRRTADPEDIAAMVLNLAAPESAYVNGADVKVDGGSAA